MQRWKVAAGATIASGALAVGMFAAFSGTAKAAEADSCTDTVAAGTTTAPTCNFTDVDIEAPASVTFTADTTPGGAVVTVSYSFFCFDDSGDQTSTETETATIDTAAGTGEESGTAEVVLPLSGAVTECYFNSVTGTQDTSTANDTTPPTLSYLEVDLDYTAQASATATASATPTTTTSTSTSTTTTKYNNQVHGFDGTCLDDKANSKSKRAEVIIWSCNNTDQAQGWTFSDSELKIHGLCVNAKGNGKSGSKLILWSCDKSGNEIWTHNSKDEFVEKANGYKLCINDPRFSTKNGTQLFVYKCSNGANEHFSKP
jgi:Ricin-type beta-trefoil lectin domain